MAPKKKLLIGRDEYDHPEHFDDVIREYVASDRYIPTALEDILLESSGHRCTICQAPWCEIHHIKPLGKKGKTELDNLIVLCPNCHTRVHKENFPTPNQLRHYKLKQVVAYDLPILSKLRRKDKLLLIDISGNDIEPYDLLFNKPFHYVTEIPDAVTAIKFYKIGIGYLYLENEGIINSEMDCFKEDGKNHISINFKLTSKGKKWINYLKESGKIKLMKDGKI